MNDINNDSFIILSLFSVYMTLKSLVCRGLIVNLDGEYECHGDQGLLPPTELVHLPHLVVLPGEAHRT